MFRCLGRISPLTSRSPGQIIDFVKELLRSPNQHKSIEQYVEDLIGELDESVSYYKCKSLIVKHRDDDMDVPQGSGFHETKHTADHQQHAGVQMIMCIFICTKPSMHEICDAVAHQIRRNIRLSDVAQT